MHNSVNVMFRQKEEEQIADYPLFTHEEVERCAKRFVGLGFGMAKRVRGARDEIEIAPARQQVAAALARIRGDCHLIKSARDVQEPAQGLVAGRTLRDHVGVQAPAERGAEAAGAVEGGGPHLGDHQLRPVFVVLLAILLLEAGDPDHFHRRLMAGKELGVEVGHVLQSLVAHQDDGDGNFQAVQVGVEHSRLRAHRILIARGGADRDG